MVHAVDQAQRFAHQLALERLALADGNGAILEWQAAIDELQIGEEQWSDLERGAAWQVEAARAEAEARGVSSPESVTSQVFFKGELQQVGGLWNSGYVVPQSSDTPLSAGQRINMVTAIRRVLEQELEANPRLLLFGEDVGPKGGVHAVTLGLQEKFGRERVFAGLRR